MMEALKRKRAYIKGQLTRLQTFTREADESFSYEELKVRLERVHDLYKDFLATENKMIEQSDVIESDLEAVDEQYYYVVPKLQALLRAKSNTIQNVNMNQTLNTSQMPASEFKLPARTIPSFDGNYREWQSFHDLYVSTVHDNLTLAPAQKFQYLKGLLRGEASALIRHFSINDANYIEAFQRLCKRYDKKKYIINNFIQSYIDQPSISKATSSNIARLHDTCDETVRGLKALGPTAEERDPWLVYIAVQKMDEETRQMWRLEIAEKDYPTLEDCLAFLCKRMDSLQGVKCDSRQQPKLGKQQARVMHTAEAVPCAFCNNGCHKLYECEKFLGVQITQRRDFVRKSLKCFNCFSDLHSVYQCKSKRKCSKCHKKHNTLLHQDMKEMETQPSTSKVVLNCIAKQISTSILPTAQVLVKDRFGNWQLCRVLLDSGSQTSFVTEKCLHKLKLQRSNGRILIKGLNDTTSGVAKGTANLTMASRCNPDYKMTTEVLIVPKITSYQPGVIWKVDSLQELQKLNLADPLFHEPGKIDILLGSNMFFEVICDGKINIATNKLIAQNTKFGWIIAGTPIQAERGNQVPVNLHLDVDASLRRFWELEIIIETDTMSEEEKFCIDHYKNNVSRAVDGRYIVSLPFMKGPPELGESRGLAIKRLQIMEKKFNRDHKFKIEYQNFLEEYLQLGHMKPSKFSNCIEYVLPHHGVIKESSTTTKLRVVFDASAKTTNGFSLNDYLAVGPVIQPTLYEILLRFRKHKIVFTADIEKMFRQIWVQTEDTKYQKIVWRQSAQEKFQLYDLQTVTYGTACAPFLATQTLAQLANDYECKYPTAAAIIKQDFYMDDLMSGTNTIAESKEVVQNLVHLLKEGGFTLRKWTSNSPEVLNCLPASHKEVGLVDFEKESQAVSVLGLNYFPSRDIFTFKVTLNDQELTKRTMLSEASKVFDPIGWLSPITITIKILFQKLWLLGLDWDDKLPELIAEEWTSIRQNMQEIEKIEINRWLHMEGGEIELHGFADASENAYAAVIYSRVRTTDGIKTNIVSAKTKVAPIKTVSIPRLELCAAVLLIKLLKAVRKSLDKEEQIKVYLYTDSKIVLDWISATPRKWKTFVANRVSTILQYTTRTDWRHVPSASNPADCASRGMHPSELLEHRLWWCGPEWLKRPPENWPSQQVVSGDVDEEVYKEEKRMLPIALITIRNDNQWLNGLLDRCSTITKVINVIARIRRLFKNKTPVTVGEKFNVRHISTAEAKEAFGLIVKFVQTYSFKAEIDALTKGRPIEKTSKLIKLYPFLDSEGMLRVGGRLENADIPYEMKHPLILPSTHRFTYLIIRDEHSRLLHAGPSLLSSTLKRNYHILRCKDEVKRIIGRCIKCLKLKTKQQHQLMGQLPMPRVSLQRAFTETGVDYAGPLKIKANKLRGAKVTKGYLALFVCMATKAVHLELVSDMTTEAFLATLKRFQARRGMCSKLYSDNGSNFVGAERELHQTLKMVSNDTNIAKYMRDCKTEWHFNPPAAPNWGGIWEAGVKSVKYHLRRVIGETLLTFEEMSTLLAQIEAILNSRPICELSNDELDPLTPGHFLVGHPLTLCPEVNLMDVKVNRLSRWQHIQTMMQHFWKRWYNEYLLSLQQRTKWREKIVNPKVGDLVIVMEKDLPPTRWLMGRIEYLIPGRDGLVRVLDIKTKYGTIKRPITKICLLPSDSVES